MNGIALKLLQVVAAGLLGFTLGGWDKVSSSAFEEHKRSVHQLAVTDPEMERSLMQLQGDIGKSITSLSVQIAEMRKDIQYIKEHL